MTYVNRQLLILRGDENHFKNLDVNDFNIYFYFVENIKILFFFLSISLFFMCEKSFASENYNGSTNVTVIFFFYIQFYFMCVCMYIRVKDVKIRLFVNEKVTISREIKTRNLKFEGAPRIVLLLRPFFLLFKN